MIAYRKDMGNEVNDCFYDKQVVELLFSNQNSDTKEMIRD